MDQEFRKSGTKPDASNLTDSSNISTARTGMQSLDGGGDGPLLSFFIPNLTIGGGERVGINLVNGLYSRGYNVELLLYRRRGKLQSILSPGVPVVELSPARSMGLGVASTLPALVRYVRRNNPRALFPHLAHVSVVSLAAMRLLNAETVVIPTQHRSLGTGTKTSVKSRMVWWLLPRLYPRADRIIAVSEGVAETLVQRTPVERDAVSVLYNPVDVTDVCERSTQPVDHEWIESDDLDVILYVGRMEEQKDLSTWLRTFRRVHDRYPNTRAVLAGTGSCRDDLKSLVADLGLSEVVSMPGYVENPFRYMRQASVFLLSSRFEGLPTVLIEALACGCPVVATDCPSGPREILSGGSFGRLAPVGDVPGLVEAVEETIESPTTAAELQRRAMMFSPEAVLDEYERFIDEFVLTG